MAKTARKVGKVVLRVAKGALVILGTLLWPVLRPLRPVTRPADRYLRAVRQEFKRVVWPSRKETWRLTLAVVIFSVVFAGFITLVDYGLNQLFEKVIIKG